MRTLTFFPSSSQRRASRTLNPAWWSVVLGRSWISLTSMIFCALRASFSFLVFSYRNLPKSRIRQTGGSAVGLTSTKSFSASRARRSASWRDITPIFSLFGPMTRTSGARISWLMRYSEAVVVMLPFSLFVNKNRAASGLRAAVTQRNIPYGRGVVKHLTPRPPLQRRKTRAGEGVSFNLSNKLKACPRFAHCQSAPVVERQAGAKTGAFQRLQFWFAQRADLPQDLQRNRRDRAARAVRDFERHT